MRLFRSGGWLDPVDGDDSRDKGRRPTSHKRQRAGKAEQAALVGQVVPLVLWRRRGGLHPDHQAQQHQDGQEPPAERS